MKTGIDSLGDSLPKDIMVVVDRGILAGLPGKVVTQDGSRVLIVIQAGVYVQIERQLLKPVDDVSDAAGPSVARS